MIAWKPHDADGCNVEYACFAICGCGVVHNARTNFVICPKCRDRNTICGARPGEFATMVMYRNQASRPVGRSEDIKELPLCGRCGKPALVRTEIGGVVACFWCVDDAERHCGACDQSMADCQCEDL